MTTTADGNVSVRAVAKTFASGKTEKLVHQTLAECDLPSGKVRWDIASPYSSVFRIRRSRWRCACAYSAEALFHPPSFDFWPLLLLLRLSGKMRNDVSGKKEERGGGEGEREEDCIS